MVVDYWVLIGVCRAVFVIRGSLLLVCRLLVIECCLLCVCLLCFLAGCVGC